MKATTALRTALSKVDPTFTNPTVYDNVGRKVVFSEKRKNGNIAIKFVGYYPKISQMELNSELIDLGFKLIEIKKAAFFFFGSRSYPSPYNGTRFHIKSIS